MQQYVTWNIHLQMLQKAIKVPDYSKDYMSTDIK